MRVSELIVMLTKVKDSCVGDPDMEFSIGVGGCKIEPDRLIATGDMEVSLERGVLEPNGEWNEQAIMTFHYSEGK